MPILALMSAAGLQSEGMRLRLGLAALLLLVAQVAAVAHFIGHSAQGEAGGCNICLHAGQSGSALMPSASPQIEFQPTTSVLVTTVETQIFRSVPSIYRSRAPPVSI